MNLTNIRVPLWRHRAEQQPGAVAFITQNQTYTWQQLSDRADQYASLLRQQGMQPGDVLTIVGKNRPEWVFCFLGALTAGITTAFLSPQPVEKLRQKLQTIYSPGQPVWLVMAHTEQLASLQTQPGHIHWIKLAELPDNLSEPAENCHYQPEHLSSLIFTSGSTGVPKAVAHTSAQHFASANGLLSVLPFHAGDCWLLSLPLYHVSGLAILYRWLLAGATLKAGNDLNTDIHDVSHASLVPVQLQRLLDNPDISLNLTHVLLGGGEIPLELTRRASACGIKTWVGYGMTEAASTVTVKPTDGLDGYGIALPGREVVLREQRIYVRGETLAAGYYSQGALRPVTGKDGWFDSKDLGHWSEGGLNILGRADNQFISGGENIHCEEIEQVLRAHPQIEQAVVVPVEDLVFGARAVAVVAATDEMPGAEVMASWLQSRLEKFKWPVAYYPMPEFLITQGIKVPRFEVKQWLSVHAPQLKVMR